MPSYVLRDSHGRPTLTIYRQSWGDTLHQEPIEPTPAFEAPLSQPPQASTDMERQDAEVARKLQLYGIIRAFKAGKCPSNEQIDIAINSILAQRILRKPPASVSKDGKVLIKDLCALLRSAQLLLLSKNRGELIQETYWTLRGVHVSDVRLPDRPVTRKAQNSDRWRAIRALDRVANVIVTNGQFRKLLKDIGILLKDIASDAATSAGRALRPSEDELGQLDKPAADHVWYTEPDFDGIRRRARSFVKPDQLHNRSISNSSSGSSSGSDSGMGRRRRLSRSQRLKDVIQNRSQEFLGHSGRDQIRIRREKFLADAVSYLETKVPADRQKSIAFRVKKMIQECQHKGEFRWAILDLLKLIKRYKEYALDFAGDGHDSLRETRDGEVGEVETAIKTLLERFANGTSLDGLLSAVRAMYLATKYDVNLRNWFHDVNQFVKKCLVEPGYILEDTFSDDWHELHSVGHSLLREKYKTQTDRLVDEVRFFLQQFEEDKQNRTFFAALKKVVKDFGDDGAGGLKLKPHLFKDLFEVFLPAALAKVSYIPLPRVEYTSDEYDVVVENIVLHSDDFTPNKVQWNSATMVDWSSKVVPAGKKQHKRAVSGASAKSTTTVKTAHETNFSQSCELFMSGIRFDLKGVAFHIKRKGGFPRLSDTGLVDLSMADEGLSVKIGVCFTKDPLAANAMRPASSDSCKSKTEGQTTPKLFHITTVDIDVSRLRVKITKSEHAILHSVFKSFVTKALKKALAETTERILREKAVELDELLWGVHNEASAHVARCKQLNRKPLGFTRRYYRAGRMVWTNRHQRKKTSQTAPNTEKKSQTKFTYSAENSLLPNVVLPVKCDADGQVMTVTGRASELKEQISQGYRWQCPVFTLGGAGQSQQIPKVVVQRKTIVYGSRGKKGRRVEVEDEGKEPSARTGTTLVGGEEEDGGKKEDSDAESFFSCEMDM